MPSPVPIKAKRVLAHRVIIDGVDHGMAVAEISADGMHARAVPYAGETWGTAFVSGTIEAKRGDDGRYVFFQSK